MERRLVGPVGVAALAKRGDTCPYPGRALLAAPFAIIGAMLRGYASGGTAALIVTFPAGAALGAATGATIC